jgi:hypothetical protein
VNHWQFEKRRDFCISCCCRSSPCRCRVRIRLSRWTCSWFDTWRPKYSWRCIVVHFILLPSQDDINNLSTNNEEFCFLLSMNEGGCCTWEYPSQHSKKKKFLLSFLSHVGLVGTVTGWIWKALFVCVCVCVCVWEREELSVRAIPQTPYDKNSSSRFGSGCTKRKAPLSKVQRKHI